VKKVLGGMVFLLLFLPLFAEPQIKDLYFGKWSNGNAAIEISEGLTGLVVKYSRPEQGKMLITQKKETNSTIVDIYCPAYIFNDVLFLSISNSTLYAVITKDNQLLISGKFFKHE
jgi:hypothetical protein